MVSIKDVAKLAGVSIATVSRYLNNPDTVQEKTRAKVQKAVQQTGYAPNSLARNFRRGKTSLVMVVLPSVGDPFFAGVMRGIWQVAQQEGYSILIRETQLNTLAFDEYSEIIFSKQADGIILLAAISPFRKGSGRLERKGGQLPPIVIGCETVVPELSLFPSVRVDNVGAAYEATRYLIELGHQRIAFMSGQHGSLLTLDREVGYRNAMKEAGLPVADEWMVEGEQTLAGSREATRQLLALDTRPTALFCANDEMAMGAMHEIRQAGLRVPEDISVMGFDDIRYAEVLNPPLSTVAQSAEAIGEHTMLRLCRAMHGEEIGEGPEIVPHHLQIRGSTTAPALEA